VARLDLGLVALGGGEETFRLSQRVEISVDPSRLPEDGLGTNLFTRVRLPVRAQTVTAVVSDLSTGEVGAARADLPEHRSPAHAVVGLSIYSMAERSLWVEVRDAAPIADLVGADRPPSVGPALRATFERGEALACGFRILDPPSGPLRLRLMTGGGPVRDLEVDGTAAGPGVRTVRFPSADLAAGDYELVVEEIGMGGATEVARVAFVIRQRS
jgi:hypothetical protein